MRDLDMHLGWVFYGLGAFFVLLCAVPPLAIVGVQDWGNMLPLLLACVAFAMLMAGVFLLIAFLTVRRKQRSPASALLNALQERLGGTILLPSMSRPFLQHRLRTTRAGADLELRLFWTRSGPLGHLLAAYAETEGVLLGLGGWGGNWRLAVYWSRPIPFKLNAVTRTKLSTIGASLAGMVEVPSGRSDLDQRIAIVASSPGAAQPFLDDDTFLSALDECVGINAPFIGTAAFAPASGLNPGTFFLTPMTDQLDPQRIELLLQRLEWIGGRLAGAARDYRQPA